MAWAIRQQAITWTNVDLILLRYMVSLGHNRLRMPHGNSVNIGPGNSTADTKLLPKALLIYQLDHKKRIPTVFILNLNALLWKNILITALCKLTII